VLLGEPLRVAVGQEPGVHLAVMTDRHRPLPQVNHLDAVRLAALAHGLVVVVPAVRRGSRTGSHLRGRPLPACGCSLAVVLCLAQASVPTARVSLVGIPALGRICAGWCVRVVSMLVSV
jgi:hypothetical protein